MSRGSRGRGPRKGIAPPTPNRCSREGCTRRQGEGYEHCSMACKIVDSELAFAQTRCTEQAVADPDGTTRLWIAAVALNDALTELYQARGAVTRRARAMHRDA